VVPELGELIPDVLGRLLIALCSRPDPERLQQVGSRAARIARLTQDRVQSLVSKVAEDQVDHAPWVVGLTWLVHEATPVSAAGARE
jgi:hypothetical protein